MLFKFVVWKRGRVVSSFLSLFFEHGRIFFRIMAREYPREFTDCVIFFHGYSCLKKLLFLVDAPERKDCRRLLVFLVHVTELIGRGIFLIFMRVSKAFLRRGHLALKHQYQVFRGFAGSWWKIFAYVWGLIPQFWIYFCVNWSQLGIDLLLVLLKPFPVDTVCEGDVEVVLLQFLL